MLACHAGGPGSIPGRCKNLFLLPCYPLLLLGETVHGMQKSFFLFPCYPLGETVQEVKKSFGDAGYRSPYLSHAKRALYHLSYVPKLQYCSYKFSVYQPSSGWNYVSRPPPANQSDPIITPQPLYPTFDSSVGRAVDCSCSMSDIHRSLVQIRLEGVFAVFIKKGNN